MSARVTRERDALMELLESTLGDLVQVVTDDLQAARASPGRVAVFVEPPDLEYPRWGDLPETTWRLDVIAGTMATQATGLDLIMRAIDVLASHDINIQAARPVSMSLAGAGTVAAYQLTLNPLELIEEE
ncbi:hypothetical protein [Bifidobacterium callitrichidarum]|uniref:DUF3168 domain-containing protein n=1 Tax=Bifidobacterium callitrichidarum TaxID=2052941 RepID=A0A2U2N7S7_9BIFI|nr:hypothetical protein [Bifidobacterium callitrichidarum]PWG65034.1 hypothetical protein DF196_07775 [Bifidobacterium callitrichidarum]